MTNQQIKLNQALEVAK